MENKQSKALATLSLVCGLPQNEFNKILNHEISYIINVIDKHQPKTIYPDIIQYSIALPNYPEVKQYMNERASKCINISKTSTAELEIHNIVNKTLQTKRFPYLLGYKKLVKYEGTKVGYGLTMKSFDNSYHQSVIIPFIDEENGYSADTENITTDKKDIGITELDYAFNLYAEKMKPLADLFNN